jgi:hypothetical protein
MLIFLIKNQNYLFSEEKSKESDVEYLGIYIVRQNGILKINRLFTKHCDQGTTMCGNGFGPVNLHSIHKTQ